MLLACVDIGSNTTRLLVARVEDGRLRGVATSRAYTRLGAALRDTGHIPREKLEQETGLVAAHVARARQLGVERLVIVATAAIRDADNRDELVRSIAATAGVTPRVLTDAEEARLAFLGASRTLADPIRGPFAVVDVGGGSTEIAVGTVADGVQWWQSFRIGSGLLADAHFHSDPPDRDELDAVRARAVRCFEGASPPQIERVIASGGSATALGAVVGPRLSRDALERAISSLTAAPAAQVARRFGLDSERVRLLPAGVSILEAIGDRLGCTLEIGHGGIREGCIFELAAE